MSEPHVLSMKQVEELERDAGSSKWLSRMSALDLIATVRAKDIALSELAGIYEAQYGALNQQLQGQLNEALAIIERCLRGWEEAQDFISKNKD